MNKYGFLELYDHNVRSVRKIKEAFKTQDVVGIVHATGTGKSYNALEIALENKDKKILYVTPLNSIIEHIESIIENSPYLTRDDFRHVQFKTYHNFINLSYEEIKNIPCDILVLDEFHHLGAPIWGARINTLIETHPGIKILGMSAYTIRDRGTIYERDMANPDGNELFSNKIVSRYDLCDAMIDGVLPRKTIYRSAYINLKDTLESLEIRLEKLKNNSKDYQEYLKIIESIKKRIHEAPSIPILLEKNIKPNGKYIYFCPPGALENTNDIETIKKQAYEWFTSFLPKDDIIFYTSTSSMSDHGKQMREAFYHDEDLDGNDVSNKLRVMFAINQYNEGIHAPNIDGVILGRYTSSDIVYFEQLGRALTVRGNTKEEYEKLSRLSIQELKELCFQKDIKIKEDASKEEIIEYLVAPVIIDLVCNFEYIKELEYNLQNRIKGVSEKGPGNKREIQLLDVSFDIDILNQDLYEMLRYLSERLTRTWDEWFKYAEIYYEHHHNLEILIKFKTNDGYTYDENGLINLGRWIFDQRRKIDPESERGQRLQAIGMRFQNKINRMPWDEWFKYAEIYYEHHRNLEVPTKFKTNDGYTYDKNGLINLGTWIFTQKRRTDPESERGQRLQAIGMRFQNKRNIMSWDDWYKYAEIYYEHHHNLEVPAKFKTNDGYTYDENGLINLGRWLFEQKSKIDPESERGQRLQAIGMRFQNKINIMSWEEWFKYAEIYFEHHHNLEVPTRFKTNDGYTHDENGFIKLGVWLHNQRIYVNPESERGQKLQAIGMRFQNKRNVMSWEEWYNYAKIYFEHHNNLEVPTKFKTSDGYTHDENGLINLGCWISDQRRRTNPNSEERIMLNKIGMVWNISENARLVKETCFLYNIPYDINKDILAHISFLILKVKLQYLQANNINITNPDGTLHEIFTMNNQEILSKYNLDMDELINAELANEVQGRSI